LRYLRRARNLPRKVRRKDSYSLLPYLRRDDEKRLWLYVYPLQWERLLLYGQMKGTNTYRERNSIKTNQGEEIFLRWCEGKGLKVTRLGFDEKQAPVDRFYDLPDLVRNLPDFIVQSEEKVTLVNVKGSLNLKEKEYLLLDKLAEAYDSEKCHLYYVFALPRELFWRRVSSVKKAYEESKEIGQWPDGKLYRKLDLCGFLDHA
jgi:hypothetical protein